LTRLWEGHGKVVWRKKKCAGRRKKIKEASKSKEMFAFLNQIRKERKTELLIVVAVLG
jgi:hypothetical protein